MAIGYGAVYPLHTTTEDGPFALLKKMQEVAEQNLKMLILTSPGERIMDNEFGVGIRNYLFWQYTPSTLSEIESRIKKQVSRYIPYVIIQDVSFNDNGGASVGAAMTDNFLSIAIEYRISPLNVGAILTIPFSA
jgi:phage baseplate assembly protein W